MKTRTKTRTKTGTETTGMKNNKNKNNKIRRKKISNRIEPVSKVEALIPDDVILIRSGSLGTGQGIR